jgi:fluoroacetyl-CoA thioesterase
VSAGGLAPGLRGGARMTVTDADAATALGSGDVPVLATPRLVALVEAAAVDALRGRLAAGITSVGTTIELEHLAASGPGAAVEADAVLQSVEDRLLRFEVRAWDARGDVARGTHTRALVDRERFLRRAGV